jgi:hypothetical protein
VRIGHLEFHDGPGEGHDLLDVPSRITVMRAGSARQDEDPQTDAEKHALPHE